MVSLSNVQKLVLQFAAILGLGACAVQEEAPEQAAEKTTEKAPEKPGYMIVLTEDVDPAGMRDYARAAVPLMLDYKGLLLFATPEGQNEVLEGGPFLPSVRVFKFPSVEAARGYYMSDEYQAAIPLRAGNGKVTVLISDAFIPDPKWTKSAG